MLPLHRFQFSNLFFFPLTLAECIHSSAFKYQIYVDVSKICIPFLTNFKFQNSAMSNSHVVFPLEFLVGISNAIGSKLIYALQTNPHCAPYPNKWNLIYLIVKILGIFLDLHLPFPQIYQQILPAVPSKPFSHSAESQQLYLYHPVQTANPTHVDYYKLMALHTLCHPYNIALSYELKFWTCIARINVLDQLNNLLSDLRQVT